ncbi:MAG: nucleoside kinase [Lachnospiraceae bacterium]|nr:nucleoside kinase [Lachnospiraceae bacterium]
MDDQVTVLVNGVEENYESGTSFETIARAHQDEYDAPIILANVNGKLCELHKSIRKECSITFDTVKEKTGYATYRRSALFMMIKAIRDVVGKDNFKRVKVEYSLSHALYCRAQGSFTVDEDFIRRVKARMDEMVAEDLPFWKRSYAVDEAIQTFRDQGMRDKERLFRYRRASKVNVYALGDFKDYYYGYMAPSTGYVKVYDLFLYDDGFMLQLPHRSDPNKLRPFVDQKKLFATLKENAIWCENLGLDSVGALNDNICKGDFTQTILMQEALHEAQIARIAAQIAERSHVKFVMIAGPSSSGKTSFSHRLSVQLRSLGKIPHPIALDNYFVDREKTPKDENGQYNFECLEAIDVEQFNNDMTTLLAGETVELPEFNFVTGKREYKGHYMRLNEDDLLVIEGIHGLNEKMSYALPADSKFKIYISALTSLNVDEHNRIATTDCRLLRRLVRDFRTRGASAQRTLGMWDSVRRGEEENIFPFQEEADAMFNSALVYELAVLKPYAESLLFSIEKDDPQYQEAKRLLKFLEYFLAVTTEHIPNNSLVREFVGGSIFPV